MKKHAAPMAVLLLTISMVSLVARAQGFQFYPDRVSYDPAIPTLEQVVGHGWGEDVSSIQEIERYLQALAAASPRVRLVQYGKTWEGRPLYYLVVASEANLARIEEIKAGMRQLADPRTVGREEADRLIRTLPAVTWLAYGIHGNEISSPDAALLTAWHLAAASEDPLVQSVLQHSVVLIDPSQNPDGRDRFVHYFRRTRGPWPDADPQAAEHNEDWPGGRTNHYLFDLNRDWFAQTQVETQARVRVFLEWHPQIFVDLHEMGANSTYYFPPQADPWSPEQTASQTRWLRAIGMNNSRWFDRMGFDYFTREVFDAFYPGYGASWPALQGAIGMTYEQASVRGLVVEKNDGTLMHFRDTVQRQFIASLSTLETAAGSREELLRTFHEDRRTALRAEAQEPVREYILPPGKDPGRTARLVSLLVAGGIEVRRAEAPFGNVRTRDYFGGAAQARQFEAGTWVVSLAQPARRMAKTLLARNVPMGEDFIREQERRHQKRQGDQIYDITAWSLPLLFGVECYEADEASQGRFVQVAAAVKIESRLQGGTARVAYLLPWGTQGAARALARMFREGIRAHSAGSGFTVNGRRYPAGSLIIKLRDNPPDLHQRLETIARESGADIHATDTSWVDEGINFGSNQVSYLKKPSVALAWNSPVGAYSAGWTRYVLEQQYGYPVTLLPTQRLRGADLSRYNVVILPESGGYDAALGEAGARQLRDWIQRGGTLIAYGETLRWLADEKVALLATSREMKTPTAESARDKALLPEREAPAPIPGALMQVSLDPGHWLAFGYEGSVTVMMNSRNIFTPLRIDRGTNVGRYEEENRLLVSGFSWEEERKLQAGKAFLMHQPHGRGRVVAFTEDPNFRAYADGLNLLFLNAVLLSPSQ